MSETQCLIIQTEFLNEVIGLTHADKEKECVFMCNNNWPSRADIGYPDQFVSCT